jgi:hypothetical protein
MHHEGRIEPEVTVWFVSVCVCARGRDEERGYIHTYIHTYIRIYIRVYKYIYIHTDKERGYIHTHIHTYVCIYIHTFACQCAD